MANSNKQRNNPLQLRTLATFSLRTINSRNLKIVSNKNLLESKMIRKLLKRKNIKSILRISHL